MSREIGVCRQATGTGWLRLSRDGAEWSIEHGNNSSLEAFMVGVLADLRKAPHDFSFSERRIGDVLRTPFAQQPADLGQPEFANASITAFGPEGRSHDVSMWNQLWRLPGGGMNSPGVSAGRFRVQVLADQVAAWFTNENYKTFNEPQPIVRELLVRGQWNIRKIVPQAFPGATEETAKATSLAETARAYEELRKSKDPRYRRAQLQAEDQREHALRSRLRNPALTAEERIEAEAALATWADERKRKFGAGWHGRVGD
jgi:hypothetical protein